jgi:hypothetical protein
MTAGMLPKESSSTELRADAIGKRCHDVVIALDRMILHNRPG